MADNESIEDVFPNVILRIKGAGAWPLASGIGGYPGRDNNGAVLFVPKLKEGTLFITNQRIVFLRRKLDWKDGYLAFKEARFLGSAPNEARKRGYMKFNAWWEGETPNGSLLRALACGGLEYCEILPDDIARLERGILGSKVRIETLGKAYCLRLTRKQADAVARLIRGRGT